MKAAAVAAVLVSTVSAGSHARHAHDLFHAARRHYNETCVPSCTTIYSTITGSPGLWTPPAPTAVPTTPATVPTPIPQTCPTTGIYTFPATTLTLTETVTACAASTTKVPSGTHTLGGVTTVVTTATTVTCPYATTKPHGSTVTSVIETTTYVCPSAGTYTIAPITTTVTVSETVVVIPVYTTYCPGTYTAPAVVTTITETDTVVYCPFTSPTPTPSVASSSKSAPTSYPSSPAGPQPGVGKGKLWAITYTPYTEGGACKAPEDVLTDIAAIAKAGFSSVRVYSTDCDTLPNVGAACAASGLKMIIGIFVGGPGCTNGNPDIATQISAITEWKRWELVELIVVGNESLFNGHCSVTQLKDLIVHVKEVCGGAGYSGSYTTTDVVSSWQNAGVNNEICDVIDTIACNVHAYFNEGTQPSDAGSFVAGQLAIVESICPGKPACVTESGWPTAGINLAGFSEQETALNSIKDTCGEKVVFFSFSNDAWKAPGDCKCEPHWGCSSVFGA